MNPLATLEPIGQVFSLATQNAGAVSVQVIDSGSVTSVLTVGTLNSLGAGTAGTLAYVQGRQQYWTFVPLQALTPDNQTIVQGVGGQWNLLPAPSPAWAQQAAWSIDPVAGNDDNPGTALAPLKTGRQWCLRVCGQTLQQNTTVNQLGDLNETLEGPSIFIADNYGGVPFRFTWLGASTAWTQLFAGTLTAATALNAAAQTPNDVTDATIGDWNTAGPAGASLIGAFRIRLTSGANQNGTAWTLKRMAATQARTSAWTIPIDPTTLTTQLPALFNPVGNETFVVERMPNINSLALNFRRYSRKADGTQFLNVIFDSIEIGKNVSSAEASCSLTTESLAIQAALTRSRCAANLLRADVLSQTNFTSCGFGVGASGSFFPTPLGTISLSACGVLNSTGIGNTEPASWLQFFRHTIIQGGPVICGSIVFSSVDGFAIFDSSSDGVQIQNSRPTGLLRMSGSALLWGNNNAGVGINVDGGCSAIYDTSKPIITGTGGDTKIGGVVKAYAAIPFTDTARLAGVYLR